MILALLLRPKLRLCNEKDFDILDQSAIADILASRGPESPCSVIFYDDDDHLCTPFEELARDWQYRNVVKLCKMYGGRIDFVRLSCGGEALHLQNKQGDVLQIASHKRHFALMAKFLLLDYDAAIDPDDPDSEYLRESLPEPCTRACTADENTCRICSKENCNCVLQPCNHLVTCFSCSNGLCACPVCNKFVENRIEIYKS